MNSIGHFAWYGTVGALYILRQSEPASSPIRIQANISLSLPTLCLLSCFSSHPPSPHPHPNFAAFCMARMPSLSGTGYTTTLSLHPLLSSVCMPCYTHTLHCPFSYLLLPFSPLLTFFCLSLPPLCLSLLSLSLFSG